MGVIDSYNVYLDDKEVAILDGKVITDTKDGAHDLKLEWNHKGHMFSWEEQISIAEVEIDYMSVLYERMSDLEEAYGELEHVETLKDSSGGNLALRWYYSERLDLRLAFLDGSGVSYDPACIKISGTASQLLGINRETTSEELALNLGLHQFFSVGNDNPNQTEGFNFKYYFGSIPASGNSTYMKGGWIDAYMAELRIEKKRENFSIYPDSLCSISKVFDLN